jgi:hypothetical protein
MHENLWNNKYCVQKKGLKPKNAEQNSYQLKKAKELTKEGKGSVAFPTAPKAVWAKREALVWIWVRPIQDSECKCFRSEFSICGYGSRLFGECESGSSHSY